MGSLPNLHELKQQRFAGHLELEQDSSDGKPPLPQVLPHRPLTATLSDGVNRGSLVRPTPAGTAFLVDYIQGQQQEVCSASLGLSPLAARAVRAARAAVPVRHWEDAGIEHHAQYVPSYSPQRGMGPGHPGHGHPLPGRRRDSLSSSAGASSVRRLIAVVRSTPSRLGPVYTRRTLCRNYAALCLGHTMFIVALMPLVALQSSVSAWWWTSSGSSSSGAQSSGHNPDSDAGSLLLAAFYGVAAVSALISPAVVDRLGPNWTLIIGYFHVSVFFAAHLYPTLLVLLPIYLLAGMWMGPLALALVACLMTLSSKLAFVLTEQEELDADAEELEAAMAGSGGGGRVETVLRRLARGLQAAHDLGLALGSLITAMLLWYTLPEGDTVLDTVWSAGNALIGRGGALATMLNVTPVSNMSPAPALPIPLPDVQDMLLPTGALLDAMFSSDESTGERICGANACPVKKVPLQTLLATPFSLFLDSSVADEVVGNATSANGKLIVLPCKTTAVLASVFLGCSIMGLALTAAFLDTIRRPSHPSHQDGGLMDASSRFANLRSACMAFLDSRLQLITPLSVFIGLEQGFMFADFSKWYVVCALGLPNVCLVFLSMGLLQSVAACTLSMLLQHIRRYIVIGVGFAFHSCLIMVLLTWIPSAEDSALFYVISAAWGVCNAIWETVSFSLVVRVYPDSWQAPISHLNLWRFLGLALAMVLHGAACNWVKLYALFGALILAVAPYGVLEYKLDARRRAKQCSGSAPL